MCARLIDMIACIVLPVLPPNLEVLLLATSRCSIFESPIDSLHSGRMAKFLPGQSEVWSRQLLSSLDMAHSAYHALFRNLGCH